MSDQTAATVTPITAQFECRHGCGVEFPKANGRGVHERYCARNPEADANRSSLREHRRGKAKGSQGEVAASAPTQQVPEVDTSTVSAIFLEDVSLRHLVDQFGPDAVIAPIGGGRGIGVLR